MGDRRGRPANVARHCRKEEKLLRDGIAIPEMIRCGLKNSGPLSIAVVSAPQWKSGTMAFRPLGHWGQVHRRRADPRVPLTLLVVLSRLRAVVRLVTAVVLLQKERRRVEGKAWPPEGGPP